MIVKRMKPFARSIGADRHEMRRLSYGSAGAAFVNFADSIITKYTGVLNYQFPTAALVLLEQAEASRQEESDRNRQVEVNWKLITYLVRNVNISVTQPVLRDQLRQSIREGISRLELTDRRQAADMKRIYERFQSTVKDVIHGGTEDSISEKTSTTDATILTERIKTNAEYREILEYLDTLKTDNRDIIENAGTREMTSTYHQGEKPVTASIFSRSFFLVLNHLIKENKLPDYKEIWRRSNELQIRDHEVRLKVSRIGSIQDPEEQLDMLNALVAEYGITRIQNSINVMSRESFEKISGAVKLYRQLNSEVTQGQSVTGSETAEAQVRGMAVSENRLSANAGSEAPSIRNIGQSVVRPDRDDVIAGSGQRDGQDVRYIAGPEIVYREYEQVREDISNLLEKAGDKITANLLSEKITEFQQVFLQNVLEPDNTADRMTDDASSPEEGADNPEIFSDWEIERLKLFANRRQAKPDAADEKDTAEKTLITRIMNKLWTFACREVTSYYIENPIKVMNKKILGDIAQVFDAVEFRGINPEMADDHSKQDGPAGSGSMIEDSTAYSSERTSSDRTDSSQDILAGNHLSQTDNDGQAAGIDRMISVFENGSLPERTLYYLSLERALTEPGSAPASPEVVVSTDSTQESLQTGTIPFIPTDWSKILDESGGEISGANLTLKAENAGQTRRTDDRRTSETVFREIYSRLWNEEEQKKVAAGDFRFLLTKRKKDSITEALSNMSQQDREYLSMELDTQLKYLSAKPEWQDILKFEDRKTVVTERSTDAAKSADADRDAEATRTADIARMLSTEIEAEVERVSADTRVLADNLNSHVQDTVNRIENTSILHERVLTIREAAERAVREVIEKTVNAPVEENVFRRLYTQILTEKEQKKAEDGDLGFMFTARKKSKIARILSEFSGEDKKALSEVLERQLEHLESGPDWKNVVVYEPADIRTPAENVRQQHNIDSTVNVSYEERLLTDRNIISEEIMHEITAPVMVDRIRDARVLLKRGQAEETAPMTSLRNAEDFMKPEENIFRSGNTVGEPNAHGNLAAYPGRDGQLVLKDTDREGSGDTGEKLITRERAQKIEFNEQKIDQVSLNLQELKMNLQYKEDELEKMKKTVSEQEKTIKRLEETEGKKKDLSEDQRRQLVDRLKNEAIIAGMRNGVGE